MTSRIALLAFSALSFSVTTFAQDAKPEVPSQPLINEVKPEPEAPNLTAKPAAKQRYLVKSGDNIWKIATAHEIEMRALLHENNLGDANSLQIGDILILPIDVVSKNPPRLEKEELPSKTAASSGANGGEKLEPAGDEEWELYTIQSGDNPWKIAREKGLKHQSVVKLNPGIDFTKLAVGQEIKIPKK